MTDESTAACDSADRARAVDQLMKLASKLGERIPPNRKHEPGVCAWCRDCDVYAKALREIATRSVFERNPDGVDQAAATMRLIAREVLGLDVNEEPPGGWGPNCPIILPGESEPGPHGESYA